MFVHVLQVYGDAVMDEAPLLILTNYHVTVFLRRSHDVQDKRLWASEPIWFDCTDPPARACWVHALQQAEKLRELKQKLLRAVVPPTFEGYHIESRPQQAQGAAVEQQATAEQQAAEADSAASSKRQRTSRSAPPVWVRTAEEQAGDPSSSGRTLQQQRTTCTSLCLRARSSKGMGYTETNTPVSAEAQPAVASLSNPEAEDMLSLSELNITDELLGAGQYGYTLRVSLYALHTLAHVVWRCHTAWDPVMYLTYLVRHLVWFGCFVGRSPICVVRLLHLCCTLLLLLRTFEGAHT